MNDPTKYVEIYFDDLSSEKQREIYEVFGDNENFDLIPIAVLTYDTLENIEDEVNRCE